MTLQMIRVVKSLFKIGIGAAFIYCIAMIVAESIKFMIWFG